MANLEYSVIAEFLVRGGVTVLTTMEDLQAEYAAYVQGLTPDYFRGGYSLGKLFKMFFDFNVNN